MAYADFPFYQDFYFGSLISDLGTFRTLSERASETLDMMTFNRINKDVLADETANLKIKKACCALTENLFYYDLKLSSDSVLGAKTSESIGAYSVSYSNPLDSLTTLSGGTFLAYQRKTALKYLGSTGLMYRGYE